MAERAKPVEEQRQEHQREQQEQPREFDTVSDAAKHVREDIERFVQGFDFRGMNRRVENFGRENPVGLALVALTFGVALGILMHTPRKITTH